jgi:hypothetical protein
MACVPLNIQPGLFITNATWQLDTSATFDGKTLTLNNDPDNPSIEVKQGSQRLVHQPRDTQFGDIVLYYMILGNKYLLIFDSSQNSTGSKSLRAWVVDFTTSPWKEDEILGMQGTHDKDTESIIINPSQGDSSVFFAYRGLTNNRLSSLSILRSDNGAELCKVIGETSSHPTNPQLQTYAEATTTELIIHYTTDSSHEERCSLPIGECNIYPVSQAFNNTVIGEQSFKHFTIKNVGNDCLAINSIANYPPFFIEATSLPLSTSLNQNDGLEVRVRFEPATLGQWDSIGLAVSTTPTNGDNKIVCSAKSIEPGQVPEQVEFNQTRFNFGRCVIGAPAPSQTLIITNRGTTPIIINVPELNVSGFRCAGSHGSHTLNGGQSLRQSLSFTAPTGGSQTATLTIKSKTVDTEGLHEIQLTGYGLEPTLLANQYLVITPRSLSTSLTALLAQKRKRGYNVVIKEIESFNDPSEKLCDQIRNFVLANQPSILLLVGDYDQTPGYPLTRSWIHNGQPRSYEYLSDAYYGMQNAEVVPAIPTGRLSTNDPQVLKDICDVLIAYPKDPDLDWRERVILTGWTPREPGAPGWNQDAGHQCIEEIGAYFKPMMEFEYVDDQPDTRKDYWSTRDSTAESLKKAINEGSLIIRYLGHGGPSSWSNIGRSNNPNEEFHKADIRSLKLGKYEDNGRMKENWKLPLVISATCLTGQIQESSFAEEWQVSLKAIGVFSADQVSSTYWNDRITQRIFHQIVANKKKRIGDILISAMQQLYRDLSNPSDFDKHTYRMFRYLGDPDTLLATPVKLCLKSLTCIDPQEPTDEIYIKYGSRIIWGVENFRRGDADLISRDIEVKKDMAQISLWEKDYSTSDELISTQKLSCDRDSSPEAKTVYFRSRNALYRLEYKFVYDLAPSHTTALQLESLTCVNPQEPRDEIYIECDDRRIWGTTSFSRGDTKTLSNYIEMRDGVEISVWEKDSRSSDDLIERKKFYADIGYPSQDEISFRNSTAHYVLKIKFLPEN